MNLMRAKIFGYDLAPGQLKIVGSVLDPTVKRLSVCAMTRYGKTRSVAIGLMLHVLNSPILKIPKRILLLAPTIPQTNILRNYISETISASPELINLVDVPSRSVENLKREMSKKRLTFKNGWETLTLTAHGKGEQLMGFGGDIIVPDEACLISDAVYTSKISRMLGDNPDAKLIELINPWHRHNFAWRHWQNPNFKHIHIGWRQALAEGRVTQVFIDEQQEELSEYEFKVLYESVFAEESEDTLIRWSWIEAAKKNMQTLDLSIARSVWGLDIGEQGPDLTILTKCLTDGIRYQQQRSIVIKEKETMPTANAVSVLVPKNETLNVDSIGVGAGVYSRLLELGHHAVSVRGSTAPTTQGDRFLNQKAQRYWQLRTVFENGDIGILNNKHLTRQLSLMRYEFTSAGKIRIVDPKGKSPDFSDSLSLCMCEQKAVPRVAY